MTTQTTATVTPVAAMVQAAFISGMSSMTKDQIRDVVIEGAESLVIADSKVQHAAYASLYYFLTHRDTSILRILMNGLSNAGDTFNKTRYDNLRYWVARFFESAAAAGIIEAKKTPLVFSYTQGDFDFKAKVEVEINKDKDGKRVVDMPDTRSEDYTKIVALLETYATTEAVANATNAIRKEKNDKAKAEGKQTMSEKAQAASEAKRLMSANNNALSAEELTKKAEVQKELVAKTIKTAEKAVETLTENLESMTAVQMEAMLEKMAALTAAINTKKAALTAAVTAPAAE